MTFAAVDGYKNVTLGAVKKEKSSPWLLLKGKHFTLDAVEGTHFTSAALEG